jgi:hypothetical protein
MNLCWVVWSIPWQQMAQVLSIPIYFNQTPTSIPQERVNQTKMATFLGFELC